MSYCCYVCKKVKDEEGQLLLEPLWYAPNFTLQLRSRRHKLQLYKERRKLKVRGAIARGVKPKWSTLLFITEEFCLVVHFISFCFQIYLFFTFIIHSFIILSSESRAVSRESLYIFINNDWICYNYYQYVIIIITKLCFVTIFIGLFIGLFLFEAGTKRYKSS